MSHRLLILLAAINLKSEVVPLLQGHDESLFRLTQVGKKREQVGQKEKERGNVNEEKDATKKDWRRKERIKTTEVWCLNPNKRLPFFHSYKAEISCSGVSKQKFLFLFLHTPLCVCVFFAIHYGNEMITIIMHSSFILMNDDKFYFKTFELNFNVVDTIFFFLLFMYVFHYYFWIISIEKE